MNYNELCVYNLVLYGCSPYNSIEPSNDDTGEKNFVLQSTVQNQENALIRKEMDEYLSKEAKEMIDLIINSDESVVRELTTKKYNCISKELLRIYYRKRGWKHSLIDKVFNELKMYVKGYSV